MRSLLLFSLLFVGAYTSHATEPTGFITEPIVASVPELETAPILVQEYDEFGMGLFARVQETYCYDAFGNRVPCNTFAPVTTVRAPGFVDAAPTTTTTITYGEPVQTTAYAAGQLLTTASGTFLLTGETCPDCGQPVGTQVGANRFARVNALAASGFQAFRPLRNLAVALAQRRVALRALRASR